MPSLRRTAWVVCVAVLAVTGCKSELDDKPAADPLDDPWVDAIDTGEDEPAMAAAQPSPAQPSAGPTPAVAGDPATNSDALALADPPGEQPAAAGEPAAGVLASPKGSGSASASASAGSSGSASKAASATGQPAAVEPSAEQPAAVDPAPTPVADPSPTEAPAAVEPAKPAEPATPPPITIADFHGNYRFVGGSAQRADLEAAIEEAADQLPGAIRGIGRKRLTKTNPIDNTLDIVITGDKVQTIFETGFDAACVIDGATVHWTSSKGDKYKVRVRSKGSKLVQIIEGEDGVKTTVFVLSADRKKLTVHHKITADRLPEPMTYRLSYSRK